MQQPLGAGAPPISGSKAQDPTPSGRQDQSFLSEESTHLQHQHTEACDSVTLDSSAEKCGERKPQVYTGVTSQGVTEVLTGLSTHPEV